MQKTGRAQQQMITIFKSVEFTVSALLQDKLSAMEKLYAKYSNHLLCETLEVARGTFLNHIKRNKGENTWYTKRRTELKVLIQKIYEENNQIYGSKKITALLQKQDVNVEKRLLLSTRSTKYCSSSIKNLTQVNQNSIIIIKHMARFFDLCFASFDFNGRVQ